MNELARLKDHPLASLPPRQLLWTVGTLKTPTEKRIIASLARAYDKIGNKFPTKKLGNDLDSLYSLALSVDGGVQSALFDLGVAQIELSLKSKGPAPNPESPIEITRSSVDRLLMLDREWAPVRMRCHEMCFLALKAASDQIRVALKAAKKKRS